MRFRIAFLCLVLSACGHSIQDQEAENGRSCYSDFGFGVNTPEFAECKMWRARLVELHRKSIFDRDQSFSEFACQDILDEKQYALCLKQKDQAFKDATTIAAQARINRPAPAPVNGSWEPDCNLASMQAAGSGKDHYQAKMDCMMAQQMQTQSVAPPQPITSDPQFCMGLAMMRGTDPLQAQMDCAMTNAITSNLGNQAVQQQYYQYQQQRALRQQQETLNEINNKLNQPRNCNTTYDRWGAHTTCN